MVSSTVFRWDDQCATTLIVGMLSIRCANIWRCWYPVEGEATPRCVVRPPTGLICDPCRNGGLILQPVAQRCGGKLALVPVGHRGEK